MPCSLFTIREERDLSPAPHAPGEDGNGSLEGIGRKWLVTVAHISLAWRVQVGQRILWAREGAESELEELCSPREDG